MYDPTIKPAGCCDSFDPASWQDKEIVWKDKLFVRDHVCGFLHIPLNMGKKIVRNMGLIEKAGAKSPHQLMLTDEKSIWSEDVYIHHLPQMRQNLRQELRCPLRPDRLIVCGNTRRRPGVPIMKAYQ